jgi:hypothetical protein
MPTIITYPTAPDGVQVLTNHPLSYGVNGAIVSEALDSDAGNVIALDRKDVVTRWIVRCPFLDDKPTKYLPVIFPQGRAYPGTQPEYKGMVVYGWDEGERIGVQEWHSSVIYRSSDELATLGWVGEGEFSEEQEHVGADVDNKLIGHSVYRILTEGDTTIEDAQADSAFGKLLPLKRTGAFKVTGADRYSNVHRFSMVRVLTALPWRTVRHVGALVWTVNSADFLAYKPGELAFANFGWREVFGAIPSAPTTDRQYEVRLQFAGNPDKWSPVELVETFTDEEGFESPISLVNADGTITLSKRQYKPYKSSAFSGIFQLLNVQAPK